MSKRRSVMLSETEISVLVRALEEHIIETRNKAGNQDYAQHVGQEMSKFQHDENYRAQQLKDRLEQM